MPFDRSWQNLKDILKVPIWNYDQIIVENLRKPRVKLVIFSGVLGNISRILSILFVYSTLFVIVPVKIVELTSQLLRTWIFLSSTFFVNGPCNYSTKLEKFWEFYIFSEQSSGNSPSVHRIRSFFNTCT